MKPRSDLIDKGVINPAKEVIRIDVTVYKDSMEASEYRLQRPRESIHTDHYFFTDDLRY